MKFFGPEKILLIVGDIIITMISVYAGIYVRFLGSSYTQAAVEIYYPLGPKVVAFTVFVVFMCFLVDLYNPDKRDGRKEIFLKIFFAGYFASFILLSICISVLIQSMWHIGYDLFIKLPVVAKRVLILGTSTVAKTMGKILNSNNNGFALSGYVSCAGEPIHVPSDSVIGNGEGLLAIALREKVQKIVVSLSERRGTFPVREVLNCKLKGIDIVDGPSFYEQLTGKLLIENMNPSHLIFSEGFRITIFRRYIKRMFDVVLAAVSIVLSLPFLLIVPVLIKLDSKGEVLFKQKRVGESEKDFTLYKFRTMVDGAEKDSGPIWSESGDNRITRVGKFLRKTRFDEIPQLFNVLCGDMSFIGPRPERPFFVESLKWQIPYFSERHCIKPGITGWAQVRYKYGDSIEDAIEKLRYDLYYIKYQSISLDLLIVLDTIKVILHGQGGR
jgi:sugar transferase (PEP-CTERM system associated)